MPSQYLDENHPATTPEDFIGEARSVAMNIRNMITKAKSRGNAPIKLILHGPPGTGKTALALYAIHLLGTHPQWGVSRISGVDLTIDRVREIASSLALKNNELFGDYRVFLINETDTIPQAAQVRWLDLMDTIRPGTAVIATTNEAVDKLEKRFQTRWKASRVGGANDDEITSFLMDKWNIPEKIARMIAIGSKGCIRVATLEAEEYLDTAPVNA